jgi:hypothetical protein
MIVLAVAVSMFMFVMRQMFGDARRLVAGRIYDIIDIIIIETIVESTIRPK